MRSILSLKAVLVVFVLAAGFYFASFFGIEYLRRRGGPWEASFGATESGDALVTVAQARRGLTGVRLVFHGERPTNGMGEVRFDRVQRPVPFGRVLYEDLTFLPGVVTLDLFGHEVELLPRALIVNRQPVPWQNGMTVDLWPTNKPALPPQPPKRR